MEAVPSSQGRSVRLDQDAESADPALPAFLARPSGRPVYHGFPLVDESRTTDGWCFGVITDPNDPDGSDWGDAFVVAPDNSRAGIVWQVGLEEFDVVLPPDATRWGVYGLPVSRLIYTQSELMAELQTWLPALRERHAAWVIDHA